MLLKAEACEAASLYTASEASFVTNIVVSRLWEGIRQSPQKELAIDPNGSALGKAASPTFSEGKVVMKPFKFFVEQVESYER